MSEQLDPHAPVLVGLGELVRRPDEPLPGEPAALIAEAIREAIEDSGAPAAQAVLEKIQAIAAAPPAAWGDGDPARRVAELLNLDAERVHTMRSSMQGGNGPQLLVNVGAERIQNGQLDAAVVCGAEALQAVVQAGKQGADLGWPAPDPERQADEVVEGESAPNTDAETAVGMIAPIMTYPVIENALMTAAGRTYDEHRNVIAGLWSRFSAVAAEQPAAWTPRVYTTEELATPGDGNRPISLPYLKLLNSNIQVDQAAAVIITSAQTATELGIPRDRWVFVHAGATATDEWFVSHRRDLHRSPAIKAAGEALYEHTGTTADDLTHVDLYSCFPSAVQLAANELGLSLERQLTSTGGLTFFGGPGNNYATHGVIAVARLLRESEPGSLGLATALGWYATKHALGIYGNQPPAHPYAALSPEVPNGDARIVLDPGDHEGTAESGTVIYERDGSPSYGILFALTDNGDRILGHTRNTDVMDAMAQDGFFGSRVRVREDRDFEQVAG